MELTLVDVIGHLAFLLTAISFYLKDILLLRFLAIVGAVALSLGLPGRGR